MAAGLFTVDDLMQLPVVGDVFRGVRMEFPDIDDRMVTYEAVRRLIGLWINDLLGETRARVKRYKPKSAADVRAMDVPLIAFSEALEGPQRSLRAFLHARMYKHYRVNRMRSKAKRVLADLFEVFLNEPQTLPPPWNGLADPAAESQRARIVCDYIAGMTDTFALEEHRRLFDSRSLA